MRGFKIIIISLVVFISCSSMTRAEPDLITKYLSLRVSLNCDTYVLTDIYAKVVADGRLGEWFANDPCYSQYKYNRVRSTYVGWDGQVLIQDACRLLDVDPTESITIYNALIEFSRDPDFDGHEVCSLEGILF